MSPSSFPHRRRSPAPTWTQLAACSVLCLFAATAMGQPPSGRPSPSDSGAEAKEEVLEDKVTVTAQRIEQALQDVPISLLVLSAEQIEAQAITDIQDLAEASPGLVVSGQASSTGEVALYIRGIGSNTFGLGTESTVGYYVDGVYIPRSQGFLNQFLDVDRLEVLRGPQGTLWGRNSTGGAINLVTKAPGKPFHGRLFADLGQDGGPASGDRQRFYLSLDGPFSERVFGRLSLGQYQADAFTLHQELGRSSDNLDGVAARGALTFLPSDSISVTVRVDHTDDDSHNNFDLKPGDTSPKSVLGTLARFYDLPSPNDPHRIAANIAPMSSYRESGLSAHANFVLGSRGTTLESISSYRDLETRRASDIDGTPLDFVENATDIGGEWWSQELKLNGGTDSVDWIAGLYAFHEEGASKVDTRTDLALFQVHFFASNPALFLFNPTDFCSLGFIAPSFLCGIDYYNAIAPFLGLDSPGNKSTGNFFDTALDTDSYAVYGQASWQVSDRFTLTGGLRYTEDDKKHVLTTIDFSTLAPTTLADSDSWSGLTPKVGLEFRPSDDVMLYGSVTTGWKSGGFNSISLQRSFDEEQITSYEVGVKSSLADQRLTLNAALFHYDYDDLQVAVLFPDRSAVENAAKAKVDGLELDLTLRPNRRFMAQLGVSLLDDRYQDFSSQDPLEVAIVQDDLNAMGIFDQTTVFLAGALVPSRNLAGHGLQRAPDYSVNLALQYAFYLGDLGSLTARGEFQSTDDIAFDAFERFVQPGYDLWHANLSWRPAGDRWSINLYGRNLGNEDYRASEIFARVTGSLRVWAPPSEIGLQLGFDF